MKLLASDLDGTLFFKHLEKGYYDHDIEAIKQFQKEGNLFGCCTGRALLGATPSFENLLECDFYIASSGAIICDKELNILYDQPLDFDIANAICDNYKNQVTIFIQTQRYYIFKEGFSEDFFIKIDSLNEIANQKIYSVCLITENQDLLTEMQKDLKEHYPEVEAYRNMDALDIVCKGCSKGEGVKRIKEIFHASDTYGIGDSFNDIPLIQDADYGVTFHSSPEAVKKYANQLVNSIDELIQSMK